MKSDSQIQQEVIDELKWEPKVNSTHIGVAVESGIVTLSGHVESYVEKLGAEAAAKKVEGVKAIAVELDVILPWSSQKSDTEIARAAMDALQWNAYRLADLVNIKVENGFITLSGEVPWHFERDSAEYTVKYLAGVKGVFNKIRIRPSISMNEVKIDIERALKRRAHEQAQEISVDINGNEVTLGGKVHDWKEKSLAMDAAWSVPGVARVIDNMSYF